MSRIFLSHSSRNNAEAIALRDWLADNGWKDEVFLDLDPHRGVAAGERWERALNEAASRCESVLFLVSKEWLASGWCRKELNLAHHLNKRLFCVLIEDLPIADLPEELTGIWQVVRLTGRDHTMRRVVLPLTHEEAHVTFSVDGLKQLLHGLGEAGVDPKYFGWPPANDPGRPPYRGLRPLEAEDAGIFFGRDAPIVQALDRLRGLRETAAPRLLVIVGASGVGKSSFLRAGLYPRLRRDDRNFLPLPVIRPERDAIFGETGLLHALEGAFYAVGMARTRTDLRAAIVGGASTLRPLLTTLADTAAPMVLDSDDVKAKPPTLILSVDQAEELFLVDSEDKARPFLALLRDLLNTDEPAIIAIFTVRADKYQRLQLDQELGDIRKIPFDFAPMPRGSYAEVIKGPARRLEETRRPLEIEETLVDALLADIEAGGVKDALPLLAFTLERLYHEYGAKSRLTIADYNRLNGMRGSIEAAIERALRAADNVPTIPRERVARLALLRRGLIPWLVGIDPDTGAPRRRVARVSQIPADSLPLIQQLAEQHLLTTDASIETGEATIEPAHEALLRQWGLLQGWLAEDASLLAMLEGVKRAGRDWTTNNRSRAWLTHSGDRLAAAERLSTRPDLAAHLEAADREYLSTCRNVENRRRLAAAGNKLLMLAQSDDGDLHFDEESRRNSVIAALLLSLSLLNPDDALWQEQLSARLAKATESNKG
jgi:hypothetical protein